MLCARACMRGALVSRSMGLSSSGFSGTTAIASQVWQRSPLSPVPSVGVVQTRRLHLTPQLDDEEKKSRWPFHLTMTEAQKKEKQERIDKMRAEEEPSSLFGKVKYYIKRYWYIAVPAHMASCSAWFAALYLIVNSGVDVVALLRFLHMPDVIMDKIQNTPESAGVVVVALILYKIVMPLRYLTTLALIRVTFATLRKMGKLRTAREVEYKVRSEYERVSLGRKRYRWRNMGWGVRSIARKNSDSYRHAQKMSSHPKDTPKKD